MVDLNETTLMEMNDYLEGITMQEILYLRRKLFKFRVMFSTQQMEEDVSVLDISVRGYNCLKRAGFNTLGDLVNGAYEQDGDTSKRRLLRLRNLGRNTAEEILLKLFYYQFHVLPEERRSGYMRTILEMNFGTEIV